MHTYGITMYVLWFTILLFVENKLTNLSY